MASFSVELWNILPMSTFNSRRYRQVNSTIRQGEFCLAECFEEDKVNNCYEFVYENSERILCNVRI